MTATIHSTRQEGQRQRVVFSLEHNGVTSGPHVEDRPLDEDPQAFADARGAAWVGQAFAPTTKQKLKALLDGVVGPGTYDGCARVLADFGVRTVVVNGEEVSITAEAVSPRDLPGTDQATEAALAAAVDEVLGAGKFAAVKAALNSQGIAGALGMIRNAEVPL